MAHKTIHKYPVEMASYIQVLPKGAEVLCVQMQNGAPYMWVRVDAHAEEEERRFAIFGTGWAGTPPKSQYIGTFQEPPFVWHLFETEP